MNPSLIERYGFKKIVASDSVGKKHKAWATTIVNSARECQVIIDERLAGNEKIVRLEINNAEAINKMRL